MFNGKSTGIPGRKNPEIVAGAVIIARIDSSRFPGKVLRKVGSLCLVELVYRRLCRCKKFNQIILATTSRTCDDELASFFESIGGRVYRGSDEEVSNVARRFYSAAKILNVDFALRVNGDSPFPDYELIDSALDIALVSQPDLITNLVYRTYPYGISVEWVRTSKLGELLYLMNGSEEEHATLYFYNNRGGLNVQQLSPLEHNYSGIQLTIDHPEDLERINKLVSTLDIPIERITTAELISASLDCQ